MAVVNYTVANGEIIAETRGGVRSLYTPDPLGSTVALYDSTQTKTDSWVYWPFGEVKTRTGTTATPFQYVGTMGYRQDSSSRTYVRARELDVDKGRWMTEDPIGFRGMDWNLYRYVTSNPTSSVDPYGLQGHTDCQRDHRDCVNRAKAQHLIAAGACIAIWEAFGKCRYLAFPKLILACELAVASAYGFCLGAAWLSYRRALMECDNKLIYCRHRRP